MFNPSTTPASDGIRWDVRPACYRGLLVNAPAPRELAEVQALGNWKNAATIEHEHHIELAALGLSSVLS